jgi:hypothetical protein
MIAATLSHRAARNFALGMFLLHVAGLAFSATAMDTPIVVATNTYSAFSTSLTNGQWVYVDADPAAGSPIRATQRSLGYREVDYKSQVPATLFFNAAAPTTNGDTVTYDYTAQVNKTNLVGFWVSKDLPIIVGGRQGLSPTGIHTTAGCSRPPAPSDNGSRARTHRDRPHRGELLRRLRRLQPVTMRGGPAVAENNALRRKRWRSTYAGRADCAKSRPILPGGARHAERHLTPTTNSRDTN